MVLVKNPFRSSRAAAQQQDGDLHPPTTATSTDSRTASPRRSVNVSRPVEPEYKLSSVSPEGTFIPPSPPEKTSFLSRFRHPSGSGSSSHHPHTPSAAADDGSGFVIPRESFDTYRRSFDIRPSMEGALDGRPSRSSLDLLAATMSASPRKRTTPMTTERGAGATADRKENVVAPPLAKTVSAGPEDNDFEEVTLDDEGGTATGPTTKKKHFWQRTSNLSGGLKKERGDLNELRAFAVPLKDVGANDGAISERTTTTGVASLAELGQNEQQQQHRKPLGSSGEEKTPSYSIATTTTPPVAVGGEVNDMKTPGRGSTDDTSGAAADAKTR